MCIIMPGDRMIVADLSALATTFNFGLVIGTLAFLVVAFGVDYYWRCAPRRLLYRYQLTCALRTVCVSPPVVAMCTLFAGMWVLSCLQTLRTDSHLWAVEIALCYLFPMSVLVTMPRRVCALRFQVRMLETCTCALFGTIFAPQSFSFVVPWLITAMFAPLLVKGTWRRTFICAGWLGCLLLLCYCQHGTTHVWEVPCKGAYHDALVRKDSLCSMISFARGDAAPVTPVTFSEIIAKKSLFVVIPAALDNINKTAQYLAANTYVGRVVAQMAAPAMLGSAAVYPSVAVAAVEAAAVVAGTIFQTTGCVVVWFLFAISPE